MIKPKTEWGKIYIAPYICYPKTIKPIELKFFKGVFIYLDLHMTLSFIP